MPVLLITNSFVPSPLLLYWKCRDLGFDLIRLTCCATHSYDMHRRRCKTVSQQDVNHDGCSSNSG